MKRKLLSILLTLAMMLTLLPATAMAEGNENVAKIGDIGYETLEAAIKEAADNATITLERSVEVSSAIFIEKTLTIDLNGCNITGKNGDAGCRVFQVIGGGNLTLTGTGTISTAVKNDTDFSEESSVIRVGDNTADKDAELTIDSGVQVSAPASYGITVFGKNRIEKLTVKGKVLATAGAAAVSGNGSSGLCATEISIEDNAVVSATGDVAIYHPQDGKLTVKNATVRGTSGIECKSGNTTIDVQNAVVTATAEKSHEKNNNGTSTKGYAIAVVDNAAYKGGATVTVSGGRYTGPVAVVKDDEDVANPGSITITGGTFSSDPSDYTAEGFEAVVDSNGTYTVQSHKDASVAMIDGTYYKTLAEAIAAVKSNETLTLLKDVSDAGDITLPAGATLDGKNHKVTGASAVRVNAAGGTVQNVMFESIHNESNRQSAIYAAGLTDTLTVTGCTFDNVDWDALQITPKTTATIDIKNNIFKHTDESSTQQRYIHIEGKPVVIPTDTDTVKMIITDNQFFKTRNTAERVASIAPFYFKTAEGSNLSGNYVEDISTIVTDYGVALNEYYPMRSKADVDIDDLTMPDYVANNGQYKGNEVKYLTMTEAIADAKKTVAAGKDAKIKLLNDVTENVDLSGFTGSKSVTFDLNEKTLTGDITANNETVVTKIVDSNINSKVIGAITNKGAAELIISTAGTVTGAVTKAGSGNIVISSGTYSQKPDESFIKTYYIAKQTDGGQWKVGKMDDADAVANGYAVRCSTASKPIYYKTFAEAAAADNLSIVLLKDVNEVNATTQSNNKYINFTVGLNGHKFSGELTSTNIGVIVDGKNEDGSAAVFSKLTVPAGKPISVVNKAIVTLKNAEGIENINVGHLKNEDSAKLTITGGTYTGTIAVNNGAALIITGGTFSQDPSAYVPAGYKVEQNANGIYTVRSANTGGSGGGGGGSTGAPASGTTQKETKPDGTVTETTIDKDGTKTVKATDPNGSVGTTTTKKDANGNPEVNADVKISEKAIEDAKKKDEPVRAPIEVEAGKDSNSAPTVKIELPKNAGETEVLVPVSNANSGTVAVLVHPDGTEEIIKDSVPVKDGIQFGLNGSATVKILDNSKDFIDTVNHWSKDDVNFVVSRELFNGVGGNLFGVSGEMTRGMVNTVLARLAGVDTNGGVNWYDKGNEWAMKNSISDGTNPMTAVTREQLATLLWRFAGAPVVDGALGFSDADEVSDYAQVAVLWATQNSIISGVGNNRVAPAASAERAQVAAMLARYLKNIA